MYLKSTSPIFITVYPMEVRYIELNGNLENSMSNKTEHFKL